MIFQHSITEHFVEPKPTLLVAFIAPFYFAKHGAWGHALGSLAVGCMSWGIGWFIWGLYAERIIRSQYLGAGWREVAPKVVSPIREGYRDIAPGTAPVPKDAHNWWFSEDVKLSRGVKIAGWTVVGFFVFVGMMGAFAPKPQRQSASDLKSLEQPETDVNRIDDFAAASAVRNIRARGHKCNHFDKSKTVEYALEIYCDGTSIYSVWWSVMGKPNSSFGMTVGRCAPYCN